MDSPESLNIQTGEPVALEVIVSGSPELKTRWFKGNEELSAGTKYQMSYTRRVATLKIQSAEKADAGEYKLEVSNEVGVASCTINLAVSGRWLVNKLSDQLRNIYGFRKILHNDKKMLLIKHAHVYHQVIRFFVFYTR